jgi:hypothetical protein
MRSFAVSTFVIWPALAGADDGAPATTRTEHEERHR